MGVNREESGKADMAGLQVNEEDRLTFFFKC